MLARARTLGVTLLNCSWHCSTKEWIHLSWMCFTTPSVTSVFWLVSKTSQSAWKIFAETYFRSLLQIQDLLGHASCNQQPEVIPLACSKPSESSTHLHHPLPHLWLSLPTFSKFTCTASINAYYLTHSSIQFAQNSGEFEQSSLLYRIWYVTPLFFTIRMRFYAAFILSEVACMTAGLGAYPVSSKPRPGYGPTELQYL